MKIIKPTLGWLLLVLLFTPVIASAAKTHTVDIDFSFNASSDPAKQLLGYRLYKEGVKVCETGSPDASRVSCSFVSDAGAFDFSLTAYYSNNTESPHSPSFPFTLRSSATLSPTAVLSSSATVDPVVGTAAVQHEEPAVIPAEDFSQDSPGADNDPSAPHFSIEVGEVRVAQEWIRVPFENMFEQPVVIVGPPITDVTDGTDGEKEPALVRVRNIDPSGFEVRLQELGYQDGTHAPEAINYLVMEKGVYISSNGTKIEAGDFIGAKGFTEISLRQSYDLPPVILTQVISDNNPDAVTGRVRTIEQASFQYELQEQQATETSLGGETIGYIAWQPGNGELLGLRYEAGITNPGVTRSWSDLAFQNEFPEMPFFIAGMQTSNGGETAVVGAQLLSQTAVKVKIEDEQSRESEVESIAGDIGYLTIGAVGN